MSTAHPNETSSPRAPSRIAIIDDNPDDIFILQRQLRRLGVTCPIATFHDGHDAMTYLKQVSTGHGKKALPDLLFLDINMPGTTGFSVLCWLRDHQETHHLKVVILSGTSDPGDVALATALTANSYLAKHASLTGLLGILTRLTPQLLPAPLPPPEVSTNPFEVPSSINPFGVTTPISAH
ncbi:MAG TPA: response regulator [Opitutaceae bacterium]